MVIKPLSKKNIKKVLERGDIKIQLNRISDLGKSINK